MSFSSAQIRKLQRDVKTSDIRTREVNGRELCYIEGWHAIAEANRIFGFDGWNRETLESRCILGRENRGTFHTVYIAKVRITVRADEHTVIREGFGTGEAHAPSQGEAHDKAIKTAETDATKRALATFGKSFGLALYVGSKQRQAHPNRQPPGIARRRTLQKLGTNGRYYVSSPPQPNPTHATTLLAELEQSKPGGSGQDESGTGKSAGDASKPSVAVAGPLPDDTSIRTKVPDSPATINAVNRLLIERPRRRRDAEHLRFVANQPCLVCSRIPSDAHHLRFAQPRALSKKVSDEFTVPLCRTHHRQLHQAGDEVSWWMDMDIDPLPIAQDLWQQSKTAPTGDTSKASSQPGALHGQ